MNHVLIRWVVTRHEPKDTGREQAHYLGTWLCSCDEVGVVRAPNDVLIETVGRASYARHRRLADTGPDVEEVDVVPCSDIRPGDDVLIQGQWHQVTRAITDATVREIRLRGGVVALLDPADVLIRRRTAVGEAR